MKRFLVGTVINAVGLWLTTLIVTAISVSPYGGDGLWQRIGSFLLVALVFGLVNAIVAPVIKVLAIPLYILTFGLISFVIIAGMLIFLFFSWLDVLRPVDAIHTISWIIVVSCFAVAFKTIMFTFGFFLVRLK